MDIIFTLKGFQDVVVSNKIEIPTIKDLLSFPYCQQVSFEDLYANASMDLKSLLNKVPLENNKKYVTVDMRLHFLSPGLLPAPRGNWHFDAESGKFDKSKDNIVHLLLSECSSMTQFLKEDIIIDEIDENCLPIDAELFVNQHKLALLESNAISMEANKFATFYGATHIHKAVKAQKPEFRFMIRVNESDYLREVSYKNALLSDTYAFDDNITDYSKIDKHYITKNDTREGSKTYISLHRTSNEIVLGTYNSENNEDINVVQQELGGDFKVSKLHNEISVELSNEVARSEEYKNTLPDYVAKKYQDGWVAQAQAENQNNNGFRSGLIKELNIDVVAWETMALENGSELRDFTPENSIMIMAINQPNSDYDNEMMDIFFENVSRDVKLIEVTNPNNYFTLETKKYFASLTSDYGKIVGTYIVFKPEDAVHIDPNVDYTIHFDENAEYKFVINPNLTFRYRQLRQL